MTSATDAPTGGDAATRRRALLTRQGLRVERDLTTAALAGLAPSSGNDAERGALSAYLAAIHDALEDTTATYLATLPRVPVARCPFTGELTAIAIDVFGIDGPWWDYEAALRPLEARPATLLAFTGALALQAPVESTAHLVKPGPGVPYVLPRLLAQDGVQAVVRAIRIGRDTGWTISYFAQHRTPETQSANDWGVDYYNVDGGWDNVAEDFDERDFALVPWIERGKVTWIAPGDAGGSLLREVSGCPYLDIAGERNIQRVHHGEIWAPALATLPEG